MAKPFSDAFYHSKAWERAREDALKRDSYLCQRCLAGGEITPATMVHHIEELTPANIDNPDIACGLDNLVSLCDLCHKKTHGWARATVGTGLAVEIPQGCVGLVFPRSGLASKHGITLSNSVGVIDSGYRGEIGATLLNQSDETTTLDAGTRVCQLIVMPFVPCELVPCEELTETERGAAGFGSTGIA